MIAFDDGGIWRQCVKHACINDEGYNHRQLRAAIAIRPSRGNGQHADLIDVNFNILQFTEPGLFTVQSRGEQTIACGPQRLPCAFMNRG